MRSTKATAALERLKARSGDTHYSMLNTADGLFCLVQNSGNGQQRLSEALPLDAFVEFVNGYGPQKVRKVSKLDVAFEKQLKK